MMRLAKVFMSSLVVALTVSAALAQGDDKSSPSYVTRSRITGRVMSQGKPVAGAVITLWQGFSEPTPSTTVAQGRTETDGNYELKDVPPGNYMIGVTAAGYVTGKENQILENLRHVNVVGTSKINPIDFALLPGGVIKGTVTDGDGKPIGRVPITIVAEALSNDSGQPGYGRDLRTDDQGTFRISGIPAGRYRVAAGYRPVTTATMFGRIGYRRIFYPNALDESQASWIDVGVGSEIADVNINLGQPVKTFSVSAKVVDGESGKPIPDLDFRLAAFENGTRIGGAQTRARSNNNGEITVANVPPGEYSIMVPGGRSSWPAGEVPPAPDIFGESKHFQVIDGDVGEIEIRVVRGATVSGYVVIEGAAGVEILSRIPEMHIVAMVTPKPGGSNPITRADIKPDGSFAFKGLNPGKLQFQFEAPPVSGRLPLRPVRIERDGIRLEQDPEIGTGDQITGLRVVLGYANSSIHGIVKLKDGVLPQGAAGRAIILRYGKSIEGVSLDPHGEFLLQNLSAGEYTLVVFARDGNNPEWKAERKVTVQDDRVLELTVSLELTPGQSNHQHPRPAVPR